MPADHDEQLLIEAATAFLGRFTDPESDGGLQERVGAGFRAALPILRRVPPAATTVQRWSPSWESDGESHNPSMDANPNGFYVTIVEHERAVAAAAGAGARMAALRAWLVTCTETSEAAYRAKSNGDDYDQDVAPSCAARGRAFREIAAHLDWLWGEAAPPAAMDALRELVVLKDLHDRIEALPIDVPSTDEQAAMRDDYRERKPKAWSAARAALGEPR